jgi:hypothetical protein
MDQDGCAAVDQPPTPRFQFHVVHVLYVMALLGVALATFREAGLVVALVVLGFWAYVFYPRSRPAALAEGCLGLVICVCLLGLLFSAVSRHPGLWRRVSCSNNLKNIALALHNYHDTHGAFPPAFVPDEDGRPMHSWRVLILPYLEEKARYDQYDFQQPWDAPDNRRLLTPVPPVYQCPADLAVVRGRGSWTSYVAIVGERTAWPGSKSRKFADFADGTSNTIWLVEDQSHQIPWMEPRDLTLDQAITLLNSTDRQSSSVHRWGDFFHEYWCFRAIGFADGSRRYLHDGLPRDVLANLLVLDDGVDVDQGVLDRWPPSGSSSKRLKLDNCFRLAVFVALTLAPLLRLRRKNKRHGGN